MGDTVSGPSDNTGRSIVGGDRVVDVDDETGLVSGVLSRNEGGRAGAAGTVASNAQLSTANVVLSTTKLLRGVQRNVLCTHEVVTSGQLGGQVDGEVADTAAAGRVGGPLDTSGVDLSVGQLVDLEPVS